jgi:hypothetical protein
VSSQSKDPYTIHASAGSSPPDDRDAASSKPSVAGAWIAVLAGSGWPRPKTADNSEMNVVTCPRCCWTVLRPCRIDDECLDCPEFLRRRSEHRHSFNRRLRWEVLLNMKRRYPDARLEDFLEEMEAYTNERYQRRTRRT